jgi:hypothetical protein
MSYGSRRDGSGRDQAHRLLREVEKQQRNLRQGRPAVRPTAGDVVLMDVAYDDGTGSKLRPVVVLDMGAALKVLPVRTVRHRQQAGVSLLRDWATAGLSRPSFVTGPLSITLDAVLSKLGRVSHHDWQRLNIWAVRLSTTPMLSRLGYEPRIRDGALRSPRW